MVSKWLVRRRPRTADGSYEKGHGKVSEPIYGEVALDGKQLVVWNGEKWLDIGNILARLDALERKVDPEKP